MSEDKTQNGYEESQELDFQDAKEMTVGEPLLGGIDNADNLAQLQKNIDAALAADQK